MLIMFGAAALEWPTTPAEFAAPDLRLSRVGGSLVKSRVMLGYDEVEEEMAKQDAGRP